MAIFNPPLPLPPAEGAFRAEGDGSFVSTNRGWIPLGYRWDTVWIWFWIGSIGGIY